jgi:hypothetical protein
VSTQSDSKSDVNPPGATIPDFNHAKHGGAYERAFRMIRRNREAGSPTRLKQASTPQGFYLESVRNATSVATGSGISTVTVLSTV